MNFFLHNFHEEDAGDDTKVFSDEEKAPEEVEDVHSKFNSVQLYLDRTCVTVACSAKLNIHMSTIVRIHSFFVNEHKLIK